MEIKSEIVTQLEYYWSQSNEKKNCLQLERSEKLMTNTLLYEDDVSTSVWERGKLLNARTTTKERKLPVSYSPYQLYSILTYTVHLHLA